MAKVIELVCSNGACGRAFAYSAKDHRYAMKISPNKKWYCCRECHKQTIANRHDEKCNFCSKEISVPHKDWINNKYKLYYCSHSCSAKVNNQRRIEEGFTTKGMTRQFNCIKCSKSFEGNIHLSGDNVICPNCHVPYKAKRSELYNTMEVKTSICQKIDCGKEFTYEVSVLTTRKHCPQCTHEGFVAAGRASAAAQTRQSKNEILFGEKLKILFPLTEFVYNEKYFPDAKGGLWDSDIIMPEDKIAIQWNGAWHYQYCGGRHSVKQVQTRDKIKYQAVENAGFTNYIIKDLGKFSEEKVKEEIDKFLLHFFL